MEIHGGKKIKKVMLIKQKRKRCEVRKKYITRKRLKHVKVNRGGIGIRIRIRIRIVYPHKHGYSVRS